MNMSTAYTPRVIVLMSGKRKCGKDYLANRLCASLNTTRHTAVIVHLSAPIKRAYASEHHLDYELLMSDGEYKEHHRAAMVDWSERVRANDADYFCRLAVPSSPSDNHPTRTVLSVADYRRPSDLAYFTRHFTTSHIFRLRIHATDVVRRERGFVYTIGIDDCATECALDDYTDWHMTFENSSSNDCVFISTIMSQIERYL